MKCIVVLCAEWQLNGAEDWTSLAATGGNIQLQWSPSSATYAQFYTELARGPGITFAVMPSFVLHHDCRETQSFRGPYLVQTAREPYPKFEVAGGWLHEGLGKGRVLPPDKALSDSHDFLRNEQYWADYWSMLLQLIEQFDPHASDSQSIVSLFDPMWLWAGSAIPGAVEIGKVSGAGLITALEGYRFNGGSTPFVRLL